jgi:hypothetical protein
MSENWPLVADSARLVASRLAMMGCLVTGSLAE